MEWRDDGIIIGGRRHGETSLILEVMTRGHGRHLGLVKGGRGQRMQPLLQPGNAIEVTWRARLEEHLGFYAVETTELRAAGLMSRPATLHGLNLVAALLRLLAEREPHEALYIAAADLLDRMDQGAASAVALVRFEALMLAESGFGLDLGECAATGARDDLVYVSPKSGRAVSRSAGEPYKDRLLALPAFLRDVTMESAPIGPRDILAGFALTGFFLARDIYGPRGLILPDSRGAYLVQLERDAAPRETAQSSSQTRRSTTRLTP